MSLFISHANSHAAFKVPSDSLDADRKNAAAAFLLEGLFKASIDNERTLHLSAKSQPLFPGLEMRNMGNKKGPHGISPKDLAQHLRVFPWKQ